FLLFFLFLLFLFFFLPSFFSSFFSSFLSSFLSSFFSFSDFFFSPALSSLGVSGGVPVSFLDPGVPASFLELGVPVVPGVPASFLDTVPAAAAAAPATGAFEGAALALTFLHCTRKVIRTREWRRKREKERSIEVRDR
ncbi:hypothetical protein PENTCL1PPCAC_22185, partial [Pristionchus entomophagus]